MHFIYHMWDVIWHEFSLLKWYATADKRRKYWGWDERAKKQQQQQTHMHASGGVVWLYSIFYCMHENGFVNVNFHKYTDIFFPPPVSIIQKLFTVAYYKFSKREFVLIPMTNLFISVKGSATLICQVKSLLLFFFSSLFIESVYFLA